MWERYEDQSKERHQLLLWLVAMNMALRIDELIQRGEHPNNIDARIHAELIMSLSERWPLSTFIRALFPNWNNAEN